MRRPEGTTTPVRRIERLPGDRHHCAGFQRLRLGHRRQDARQAFGQHGLAGAGRPISSKWWPPTAAISNARRACNWPRTSIRSGPSSSLLNVERGSRRQQLLRTPQPAADIGQRVGHPHVDFGNQCRLFGIGARHHHATPARPCTKQAPAARRIPRRSCAGQRQFAEKFTVIELFARHLMRRRPECPAQWPGRNGRHPWAARPAPGSP